jgi:Na+-driven multidrug efflux pump
MSIGLIVMNLTLRPYGDAAVAAIAIVNRVTNFIVSMVVGLGQGFQPVCGFNYGAKRYDRVLKAFFFCVKVTVVALVFASVLGFAFARPIVALFRDDPEVIQIGTLYLRLSCIPFPTVSWGVLCSMMTQNIGEYKMSSFLSMARHGLCLLPMILILPRFFGLLGAQCCQPASDVLTFAFAMVIGVKTVKKLKRLQQETLCQAAI